jgi:hypothetical protein
LIRIDLSNPEFVLSWQIIVLLIRKSNKISYFYLPIPPDSAKHHLIFKKKSDIIEVTSEALFDFCPLNSRYNWGSHRNNWYDMRDKTY